MTVEKVGAPQSRINHDAVPFQSIEGEVLYAAIRNTVEVAIRLFRPSSDAF